MSKTSLEVQIERVARDTVRYLRRDCGGAFFVTASEWIAHAKSHEIMPVPVENAPGFTAIAHAFGEGKWFLLYNSAQTERAVIGYIVHELAEIIVAGSDRCQWEAWPVQPSYHYTGGQSPEDIRHQAAQWVEKWVLEEIEETPET